MLLIKKSSAAHELFQEWRRRHVDSYIVNVKSPGDAVLHRNKCQHLGDAFWSANSKKGWGDMGNTDKACFETKEEAVEWARAELKNAIKICKSCNP